MLKKKKSIVTSDFRSVALLSKPAVVWSPVGGIRHAFRALLAEQRQAELQKATGHQLTIQGRLHRARHLPNHHGVTSVFFSCFPPLLVQPITSSWKAPGLLWFWLLLIQTTTPSSSSSCSCSSSMACQAAYL